MSMIFMSGNESMKFFIENCHEKSQVSSLVEANGGIMLDEYQEGAIELVPYEQNFKLKLKSPKDHPIYSYKFVIDSDALGEIQNLKDYLIQSVSKNTQPTANKSQGRKAYTSLEDNMMILYVKNNPGCDKARSYWEQALKNGLQVDHSAESLKFHWKSISTKPVKPIPKINTMVLQNNVKGKSYVSKENNPTKANLSASKIDNEKMQENSPDKPQEGCFKRKLDDIFFQINSKRIKSSPAQDSSNGSVILLEQTDENSRSDMAIEENRSESSGDLRQECMERDIPAYFIRLVAQCRKVAGKYVREKDVLKVLLEKEGKVAPTINAFTENLC
ncbi:unnamed protein product [Blepharisma stoltei]|uniref:BRCT domain-containing protein n=1 Tax=Blepharisma stoltei TaxID=1481888 RepID=A0AAU9JYT3_9CILI|nr:unnamed protein product [Blepharisma stoltei]